MVKSSLLRAAMHWDYDLEKLGFPDVWNVWFWNLKFWQTLSSEMRTRQFGEVDQAICIWRGGGRGRGRGGEVHLGLKWKTSWVSLIGEMRFSVLLGDTNLLPRFYKIWALFSSFFRSKEWGWWHFGGVFNQSRGGCRVDNDDPKIVATLPLLKLIPWTCKSSQPHL